MINLISTPIVGGFSFTLTTYALEFLKEAETLYGDRTKDFVYGGIEFNETGPRIWFPYNRYTVIQLTPDTANDLSKGIFQLSHEVVHLLSPLGKNETNVLEEGLATYFSKITTDKHFPGDYAINGITPTNYLAPFEFVRELLAFNPNSIKELRKIQPLIGLISKEDFKKANIAVKEALIDNLVKPMVY